MTDRDKLMKDFVETTQFQDPETGEAFEDIAPPEEDPEDQEEEEEPAASPRKRIK